MPKRHKKTKKQKLYVLQFILLGLIIVFAVILVQFKPGSTSKTAPYRPVTTVPPDVPNFLKGNAPATPSGALVTQPVRVPILLYHYVEHVRDRGDTIRISLNILPEVFDAQVKTLLDAGYTFITPSDLALVFDGKSILPQKPVILSFDDGYRDFYTDVFPILKKYNVRAIEYVVTGFLDKPNNLKRPQLAEIIGSGLVEIGGHTVDHSALASLSTDRMKFEIEQNKEDLEKEFHIHLVSFAYPYGSFDVRTLREVEQAGYKTAVTTLPGVDMKVKERYLLPRIRPGARTGRYLLDYLTQSKFTAF